MGQDNRSFGLTQRDPIQELPRLRWPLRLTYLGMCAERITHAFWPFWSVLFAALALILLGVHEQAPIEFVWGIAVLLALGVLGTLIWGIRRLRWPSLSAAMVRLDSRLPGRPIQSMIDTQLVGGDDAASKAVWVAHQRRMEERAAKARAVEPNLRVSKADPFAMRYVAVLMLAVAVLFGSIWRVGTIGDITPNGGQALASGPTWEGWMEPPSYTGLATIYLADVKGNSLSVPQGSQITLRLYGEVGALTVSETVSGRVDVQSAVDPSQEFEVVQPGEVVIDGPGGHRWTVSVIADVPPSVRPNGEAEVAAQGEMTLPFAAVDDYGIASGQARISLDLDSVDRRYGLALDPEPREDVVLTLPMPFKGSRAEFEETIIDDFSQHPWANLPVKITLSVLDDAGQQGMADPIATSLPARRFFDPVAAAVIEQRRDLLWNRENGTRITQILRTISHKPEKLFRKETAYLKLRFILRRMESYIAYGGITDDVRDELAVALWDLAILLEEGDLGDALERLRRAQDRLAEAMKNGASDQEIAELMQELREATQDYMRQLSRQAQQDQQQQGDQQSAQNQNMMQMSQDDLQRMMDRIQELMEQGRMAEAEQALEELRRMMENMRVTQGQQGQGQQSPGQQAMEGLAETLRDQQGLSDEAFRDLQEQFNPNAQQGQSQNNQGRNGGEGQGESHEGQQGQGQGEGDGQGNPQADNQNQGEGSLADRQEALRRELERQRGSLPGQGTEQGDAAREALRRADRAMEGAEDALRNNDIPEAIDRQADAMEALREGLRNLGEALAQEQRNQGQQGQAEGNQNAQQRDPLGRNPGANGQLGTDEDLLQGDDVYRRARDLLDEIRRRSGEGERPQIELEYLKRLLERF